MDRLGRDRMSMLKFVFLLLFERLQSSISRSALKSIEARIVRHFESYKVTKAQFLASICVISGCNLNVSLGFLLLCSDFLIIIRCPISMLKERARTVGDFRHEITLLVCSRKDFLKRENCSKRKEETILTCRC